MHSVENNHRKIGIEMNQTKLLIALTILSLSIAINCQATTYAEFQLKCVEKKLSSNNCLKAFEYAENDKANSAYAQKDYATAFPMYLENAKKGQIFA